MRAVALAFAASLLLQAADGPAIQVVKTFPGLSGPTPADAASTSADMMGGVSPKYLVGSTNAGFTVLAKETGRDVQPPQTQMQFWTAALNRAGDNVRGKPYDPKIFFDTVSSRWFAAANENVNGLSNIMLFAVSADDDPTHPWKAVRYEAPWPIDNTKLGLDRNGFYSTAIGGSRDPAVVPHSPVVAVPKADLLWQGDGKPSIEHLNMFDVAGVPRMSDRKYDGTEGMVPALDMDPAKAPTAPEYYVNRYRKEVDGETFLQIRKVSWTSPGKAAMSEPVLIGLGEHYTVQPTSLGIQPPLGNGQFSPGIRAGEARIVNAVVKNGSLWTIAAAQMGDRTGAFWVQVDLATMKLVQHGKLADPAGDLLFPSINVDGRGNVGIGMSRTSAEEAPSIYVTGRLASDPPNTLRPLVRAVQGKYVHYRKQNDLTKPGDSVSWSDYSTVVVDPSDPTLFWTYQEATTNPTTPIENADRFGTHWVAWRVGGPGATGKATGSGR